MTKQALRPDYFLANMPSLQKDKEAAQKGATEEEQQLYSMSRSKGWGVLKEHINRAIKELELTNTTAIEKGASFDQIGQNTVIISTTKAILERIIARVDDAIEACVTAIKDEKKK